MAKTPKIKKATSLRSRAARRATSLSTHDDGSWVTSKTNAHTSEHNNNFIKPHHSDGVSKRKKVKPLSRQKKLRREKGIERAGIVLDKLESKFSTSRMKRTVLKERRAAWQDLNSTTDKRKVLQKKEASTMHDDDHDQMGDDEDTAIDSGTTARKFSFEDMETNLVDEPEVDEIT